MTRLRAATAIAAAVLAGCGGGEDGPAKQPERVEPGTAIVAIGDSITAGAPGWDPHALVRQQLDAHNRKSQWEYWAAKQLTTDARIENCGVSGERTDQILERLDSCLDGAGIAVLQGGINDLVQGLPPETAAGNMRSMVERAREAGVEVFVANLLPLNGRPQLAPLIDNANELYAEIANEAEVELIDFHGVLEDPEKPGRMRPDWTAEGLHPSVEGYRRLARAVARACIRNSSCSAR